MHGCRSHGIFRDSPGDALTQCLGCNVQVSDRIWPGGNPESMHCQRGQPYLNSKLFVILAGWGRSQKFIF